VSFLDRFTPKANSAPEGVVEIKVEFTAEENEAMNRTLDRYAAIANAHAPEGTWMFVPPKVMNAMSAQGPTEYVEELIRGIQDCASDTKIAAALDKAIKAQMKAYAFHNLPICLSQLASIYELAGDAAKSREFFELFLRAQDEFAPDRMDADLAGEVVQVRASAERDLP
jgi:hypothetical protein